VIISPTLSIHQSTGVTDGMTVTLLTASLQHKITASMDYVCHITLNQKLSCIVYAKSCKTEHYCINS